MIADACTRMQAAHYCARDMGGGRAYSCSSSDTEEEEEEGGGGACLCGDCGEKDDTSEEAAAFATLGARVRGGLGSGSVAEWRRTKVQVMSHCRRDVSSSNDAHAARGSHDEAVERAAATFERAHMWFNKDASDRKHLLKEKCVIMIVINIIIVIIIITIIIIIMVIIIIKKFF